MPSPTTITVTLPGEEARQFEEDTRGVNVYAARYSDDDLYQLYAWRDGLWSARNPHSGVHTFGGQRYATPGEALSVVRAEEQRIDQLVKGRLAALVAVTL